MLHLNEALMIPSNMRFFILFPNLGKVWLLFELHWFLLFFYRYSKYNRCDWFSVCLSCAIDSSDLMCKVIVRNRVKLVTPCHCHYRKRSHKRMFTISRRKIQKPPQNRKKNLLSSSAKCCNFNQTGWRPKPHIIIRKKTLFRSLTFRAQIQFTILFFFFHRIRNEAKQ